MTNTSFILILCILLLLSAFFSASETAFSSLNKIRLKNLSNNGDNKALEALNIAENYSKFISTVLVGNNIVNIIIATIATVFFTRIIKDNGALVSTIVTTILVIIFGEIVPKRIAKVYPEKFAITVSSFISFLMIALTPLTIVFDFIGNTFEKIFDVSKEEDEYNSEELVTMVEEAEEQGDMDEHEADLITNAIEFNDLDVSEIFTPRVDVIACSNNDSIDEIEKKFRETGYSRLPYYKDSIDNIIGVIHEKDFYQIYYKKSSKPLSDILQKVIYTNGNVKISYVLRQLQSNKSHLAVVVDEYGGTEGIITMEDILEELVGEIYDEHDEIIEFIKKINDNKYVVNCDCEIDEFFDYFKLQLDDKEFEYNTVSGWIIDEMNKIPKKGEIFVFENIEVSISNSDEKEVKEAIIRPILDDKNNE